VSIDLFAFGTPDSPPEAVQKIGVADDQDVGVAARQWLGNAAIDEATNNPRAVNGASRDQQGSDAKDSLPCGGLI